MSDPDATPITADPALIMLAVMVERGAAASLPITLIIGGSLVAGTLISASAYRERLAQSFAAIAETEAYEASVRQLFGQVFAIAGQHEGRKGSWLHLADCVMIQNGQVIDLAGAAALIRVQTAAVVGWLPGKMVLPAT